MKSCVFLLLLPVLAAVSGCDYFQSATETDCTALFDHMVDVNVKDATGATEGTDQAASESRIGEAIAGALGRAALDALGEKEKFVNRCQATLRRYEVRSCLEKKTPAELKACGAP